MKKITGLSLILLLVMWLIPLNVQADNTAGDVKCCHWYHPGRHIGVRGT